MEATCPGLAVKFKKFSLVLWISRYVRGDMHMHMKSHVILSARYVTFWRESFPWQVPGWTSGGWFWPITARVHCHANETLSVMEVGQRRASDTFFLVNCQNERSCECEWYLLVMYNANGSRWKTINCDYTCIYFVGCDRENPTLERPRSDLTQIVIKSCRSCGQWSLNVKTPVKCCIVQMAPGI